jgi:hypothetical protein
MKSLDSCDYALVSGGHPAVYAIIKIVAFYEGYKITKKVLKRVS